MCGFLIYYLKNHLNLSKRILQHFINRGPDLTSCLDLNGYFFTHFLLHITGLKTPQPFIYDNIICVYNGEIYNYQELEGVLNSDHSEIEKIPLLETFKSDGQCLIPLYRKYGYDFINKLDGEYAICLYDFNKNVAILATDTFGTKPLWYTVVSGKLCTSSHQSALKDLRKLEGGLGVGLGGENNEKSSEIIRMPPNTRILFDLATGKIISTSENYTFDLRQYKDTYDDWIAAFNRAIEKRTRGLNYELFICLSSGYDSGCICSALLNQGIHHNTYTILANENQEILKQRIDIENLTGASRRGSDFENKMKHAHAHAHAPLRGNIVSLDDNEFASIQKKMLINCESYRDILNLVADKVLTMNNFKIKDNYVIYEKHRLKNRQKINIKHIHNAKKNYIYPIDEGTYYIKILNKHQFKLCLNKHLNEFVLFREASKNFSVAIEKNKRLTGNAPYDKVYYPQTDWAAVGLYKIFQYASQRGQRIYLSGQGGDEIYADYGFNGKRMKNC